MKRIDARTLLLSPWLTIVACTSPSNPGLTSAGTGSGGAGASSSSGTGAGGAPSSGGGDQLPCEVASVLGEKCQGCHSATPLYGAPMSLMTYANTQAPAFSNPSFKVWQMMQMRVHSTTSPMPPAGQPPLATAELAAFDSWFSAGAPAGNDCTSGAGGPGIGTGTGGGGIGAGGVTSAIGPQYLPCTPSHVITAHAAGSTTAKYPVPNPTNDFYVCFNFKSPFAPGEQSIANAPIIDDARVIHHWILYGTTTPLTDGSITNNCAAIGLGATQVAGWAPGGGNAVMDPDVGMVLDYPYFQLQVHYNNHQYADGADASGVAFCTTNTPRPNVAGIVTLGPMFFSIPANANDYPVSSSCSNLASDGTTPMTIIGTSPHMHLLGSGFTTDHLRGTTSMGLLSNVPLGTWSFENQKHYPITPRRQFLPGDTLKTTCYYDNSSATAVNFGTRTTDEMCFDFITVYPYAQATQHCSSLF